MSAPDIATLFAYEELILPAWAGILNDLGLNAFVEFSDASKTTPWIDVFLDHADPTGHRFNHNNGQLYFDAWEGRLVHQIWTQRGLNSDQQAPILSQIRTAAINFMLDPVQTVLQYHAVLLLEESKREPGLTRGVDHTLNLDWSKLPFDIIFQVRADAWPL